MLQTFLGFFSLRTGVELLTLIFCINKLTGVYGILAIFTGYHLNPLQLSHYIYSLIVLILGAYLSGAIREREQPLKVLALAWLYVLDTVINSAYTALFGASWFIVLAQHLNDGPTGDMGPGAGTINDTAGFTDPKHPDVSNVDIVAEPAEGAMTGQDAKAYPSTNGTLGGAVFQSGSIASITVLCILWLVRIYFCIIVLSYARGIVRQYVLSTSTTYSQSDDPTMAENPFRVGRDEGAGWRGKLGRAMVRFPKRYWLGKDDSEDEWVRTTQGRFGRTGGNGLRIKVPEPGVGERERRARSGTGPPPPPKGKVPS